MKKTVFITGASSGIGLETAKYFLMNNWNVIASMRNPEKRVTELHSLKELTILHLDVLDERSIKSALDTAINLFGKIDVMVNNAGYALMGPFETSTNEEVNQQINTNVLGLLNVTRRIIPHFRNNNSGTIINVASIAGKVAFPFASMYHLTKWAVEGFSESLHYELEKFNIKVKIIEPGPIKTDFYYRSLNHTTYENTAYGTETKKILNIWNKFGERGCSPIKVAKIIFKAATSNGKKLRYPVNSMGVLYLRRILPDSFFNWIVKLIMK